MSTSSDFTTIDEYRLLESVQGQSQQELLLIVGGKPVSGKSTLINNILGPGAQTSVESPGRYSQPRKLIRKFASNVGGTPMQLFDANSYDSHTMSDLASAVDGKDIALVYCLSMNYGSKVEDSDVDIIKKLSSALTPKIWKSTILALTFANKISAKDSNHRSIVENYAHQFEDALRNGGVKDVRVRSIFNDGGDQTEGVIAIPVGKGPTSVPMCSDWNEKLLQSLNTINKLFFKRTERHPVVKAGLKVGVGTGLGAGVGAMVGVTTGLGVGVVSGIVVGGLIGGSLGVAVHYCWKSK